MTVPETGGGVGERFPDPARVLAERIHDVPDFPRPGVVFKDLTPFFADGPAFATVIDAIRDHHSRRARGFDVVAGVEARGFILAAAVAYAAGVGMVAVRKSGKLPRRILAAPYTLEYGEATLEIHADAVPPGARVLLVDDVLATGGTAAAACDLIERAGGEVVGCSVLLELASLGGRDRMAPRDVHAVLTV